MKLLLLRRLASALALLVLLLGQAWAGPTLRVSARPCCCKPGAPSQPSVARAKCCGQAEHSQVPTRGIVRAATQVDQTLLAVLPACEGPSPLPAFALRPRAAAERPSDHGIGSGLPYRLRI